MFRKAVKSAAKIKIGICGAAGSGKTYSSLLLAKGLGERIAVIDTENNSASLYADVVEFDTCVITAPYEISKYIAAISEAEKAGYDVIIIDSLTHAWAGEGGLLDKQGKIADSGKGNSYTAWRTITPEHNRLVEKILSCKTHVIATMRSKMEYSQEKDDKGRSVIKKIGLAPIQREGMDYEFTLVFDVDCNHISTASKDRTGIFDGKFEKISVETSEKIKAWLTGDIAQPEPETKKETKGTVEELPDGKKLYKFPKEIDPLEAKRNEWKRMRKVAGLTDEQTENYLKLVYNQPTVSLKQLSESELDRDLAIFAFTDGRAVTIAEWFKLAETIGQRPHLAINKIFATTKIEELTEDMLKYMKIHLSDIEEFEKMFSEEAKK
jgi:hypothetical protein